MVRWTTSTDKLGSADVPLRPARSRTTIDIVAKLLQRCTVINGGFGSAPQGISLVHVAEPGSLDFFNVALVNRLRCVIALLDGTV